MQIGVSVSFVSVKIIKMCPTITSILKKVFAFFKNYSLKTKQNLLSGLPLQISYFKENMKHRNMISFYFSTSTMLENNLFWKPY